MRESGLSDLWYKLTWRETDPLMYGAIRLQLRQDDRDRDGPAKGTFRLVFNENDFPEAVSNLQQAYSAP